MDRYKIIRYFAYTIEILILYMVQETPGLLPEIGGARTEKERRARADVPGKRARGAGETPGRRSPAAGAPL